MASSKKARRPVAVEAASAGAVTPKAISKFLASDGSHTHPVFSLSLADRTYEGEWGWKLLDGPAAVRLIEFLSLMGCTSWTAVRQQTAGGHYKHHYQPVTSLCSPARRRLRDLELDDLDPQIFRFRDGNLKRLWGFVSSDGIFFAIWWDPNHKVYPTEVG